MKPRLKWLVGGGVVVLLVVVFTASLASRDKNLVRITSAKVAKADGLLVIYLSGHGGEAPVLGKLFDTGLPAALFFQPFGGHGWMYFQDWRKQGKKVLIMSTSDWSHLDRAVAMMRAAIWMKPSA